LPFALPKLIGKLLQFVNFTDIMSTSKDMSKKEAAFALAALMEIPSQYKATQGIRYEEKQAQRIGSPRILPPPNKVIEHHNAAASHPPPTASSRSTGIGKNAADEQVCPNPHLFNQSKGHGFSVWSPDMQGMWSNPIDMPIVLYFDYHACEALLLKRCGLLKGRDRQLHPWDANQ